MVNNIINTCYQLGTFNYGQRPQQNSHYNNITCRLCNQVIPSFQAFIAHIESHFAQENHTMKSSCSPNDVNSQREMIPSSMKPNIARSMQETRNLVNNKVFRAPQQQQPMVMPQPTTNSFPYASQPIQPLQRPPQAMAMPSARNNVAGVALEMEVSPIDGTRPYINLLERPINNEFVNWANLNGDSLDLALRL